MPNKIVFFGTSKIASFCLTEILKIPFAQIDLIITKHDKTPVAELAKKHNLPVLYCSKVNKEITNKIKQIKPIAFFIVDFGVILPQVVLDIPSKGAYNLHFSMLPRYRGASPVQSAILAGEQKSGITIFHLNQKMDAGKITEQAEINISNLRADQVYDKMLSSSINLINNLFTKINSSEDLSGKIQDENQATYCSKITKNDGNINPKTEKLDLFLQKVRAFYPWPSVFFAHDHFDMIKILNAKKAENINTDLSINLGELFKQENRLFLKLQDGVAEILEIQRSGKKAMSGVDFAKAL
jgi:methionyl-tRNA formyltransferase